jgi:eukaryotic-like serine/threonine-protein kinase
MAPEQVEPSWGPLTARTDVYDLGAILFTLLTGRPPHEGGALEVLAEIASGQWPKIPAGVRPELAEICRRCLAANPGERFPTAISLVNALSAAPRDARLD